MSIDDVTGGVFGEQEETTFNISIIGDKSCGKTSLFMQYTENRFVTKADKTCKTKYITVCGNKQVRLNIRDSSPIDKTKRGGILANADGVILMFDSSKEESFERVSNWISNLTLYAPNAPVLLLAHKSDQKVVNTDIAARFAKSKGWLYQESSSRDKIRVEEPFKLLAEYLLITKSSKKEKSRKCAMM
jgi:small GTP-binding protein